MKISPLILEITQGVSVAFGTKRQKSTYHTKYPSKHWTELHQLFSIGRLMYVDYTRSSAIVEGLHDTLVSTNHATTKHPI